MNLILGSSSPRRLELLKSINIHPKKIISPDIDESQSSNEHPLDYCKRIALKKLQKLILNNRAEAILSADTIVYSGRKLIDKTDDPNLAMKNIISISGKKHRVATTICICDKSGKTVSKTVLSIVTMKRLNKNEIEKYIQTSEWVNVAGSYKIQGYAEAFIKSINGSYSNIVGLPLYETRNILNSMNIA